MEYKKGRFTVTVNDPPPEQKGRFTVFKSTAPVSRTTRQTVVSSKPNRARGSPKGPVSKGPVSSAKTNGVRNKTSSARRKSPVRQDRFATLICQLKTLVDKYYIDVRCH